MKTSSLVTALAFMVAASVCFAGEPTAEKAKEKKKAEPAKAVQRQTSQPEQPSLLTGSYLKQKVRRSGMITDRANNVLVLDSETIRNSGAADLKQLLIRRGIQ